MSAFLAPRITASGQWPSITVNIVSAGGGGGQGGAVTRVNGKTGDVVLDADDVGADPAGAAGAVLAALGTAAFLDRGVAGGVASLDGDGTVPDVQLPSSIARDSEVTAAVAAAVAALPVAAEVVVWDEQFAADAAARSVTVTGCDAVRVVFAGRSTRAAVADSLLATVNGVVTASYFTDASSTATTAWTLGGVPGALTNTDRRGRTRSEIDVSAGTRHGGFGDSSTVISTTTGGAVAQARSWQSDITAPATTIEIRMNAGMIAAGSRLRIIRLEPTL